MSHLGPELLQKLPLVSRETSQQRQLCWVPMAEVNSVTVIQHLLGMSDASRWHPEKACMGLGSHHFLLDMQWLLVLHWAKQSGRFVLSHLYLKDLGLHPQLRGVNGKAFMKCRWVDFQAVLAYQLCQFIFTSVTPARSHLNMYQNNSCP